MLVRKLICLVPVLHLRRAMRPAHSRLDERGRQRYRLCIRLLVPSLASGPLDRASVGHATAAQLRKLWRPIRRGRISDRRKSRALATKVSISSVF